MKKVFKSLVFCLGFVLLFAGCAMKAEYGIEVGKDKNVTVEVISAMDDELIDSMLSMSDTETESDENKTYTDEERWKYVDDNIDEDAYEGYTKERYTKDGYKGYVFKKNLGNIDDLSAEDVEETELGDIDEDSKIFIKKGDTYTLRVKNDSENETEMEEYKDSVMFDVKLVVTLPNKAISNNATEVSSDGLTYTWDLVKTQDIDLTFDFSKSGNKGNEITTTKKNETTTKTTVQGKENNEKENNENTETVGEKVKEGLSDVVKYALIGGAIFLGIIIIIIVVVVINSKKKKGTQPNYDQMNIQQPVMNNQAYNPINQQPMMNNQETNPMNQQIINQQPTVENQPVDVQPAVETQPVDVQPAVETQPVDVQPTVENQSVVETQNDQPVSNDDQSNNQTM